MEVTVSSILIVDDQPHMRALLSEELKDMGCEVESVDNVESVRRCFEDSSPDLVLLDLYLKGFDGWEVLHDIKRWRPRVPVLIVTAYDSFTNDPRASQADGYVVKSFTHLDKLKQKIADLLASKYHAWRASPASG
jgi:two-component system response regulator (stage 0 sporulation protein F)